MNIDNFKNNREDKDFFPYEYGAEDIDDMKSVCFTMFGSKEFESNLDLILKHLLDVGIQFSSPGGSFKRKFWVNMSRYLNFKLRYPRAGENLKKDSKLRELLEPLAKIICLEREKLEKWKKENPNGFGEYKYLGGKKYEGEFREGEHHGKGKYTFPEGGMYVGEFKNGLEFGKGTRTFPNGDKYEGEWKNGKINGQGIFTYSNGEKYEGEWKNGKRWNGKGTCYLPFGGIYEGEWKNGLKEGQGILTTETSEYAEKFITRFAPNSTFDEVIDDEESHISKTIKIIGEFKSDTIWNGNEYDEDGKIIRKYVNGEEIEE